MTSRTWRCPAPEPLRLRSLEEAETIINAMRAQLDRIDAQVQDHRDKFDTLESPLWKRVWFRVQRWPGQRDLNADRPGWLPAWLRRIVGQ